MNREKPVRKPAGRPGHLLHDKLTPREARLLAASPGKRKPQAPKKK